MYSLSSNPETEGSREFRRPHLISSGFESFETPIIYAKPQNSNSNHSRRIISSSKSNKTNYEYSTIDQSSTESLSKPPTPVLPPLTYNNSTRSIHELTRPKWVTKVEIVRKKKKTIKSE